MQVVDGRGGARVSSAAVATESLGGSHTLIVDGDWVEVRAIGTVDLDTVTRLHAVLERVLADHEGRAFVLADIAAMGNMTPEARRSVTEWDRHHKVTAAAISGGGFAVRTVLTLVLKAVQLLNHDSLDRVFTGDAAEARAWLLARRQQPRS